MRKERSREGTLGEEKGRGSRDVEWLPFPKFFPQLFFIHYLYFLLPHSSCLFFPLPHSLFSSFLVLSLVFIAIFLIPTHKYSSSPQSVEVLFCLSQALLLHRALLVQGEGAQGVVTEGITVTVNNLVDLEKKTF